MGGDNFDKSSKGEIIDSMKQTVYSENMWNQSMTHSIWDIHELIKRAASNGGTTLRIVKRQGEKY